MVTADQRRQAVRALREPFGVSERRACRALGHPRSTQRQAPRKVKAGEERLLTRMLAMVRKHPRYGYRRIWALLRREGWRVNRKRVGLSTRRPTRSYRLHLVEAHRQRNPGGGRTC